MKKKTLGQCGKNKPNSNPIKPNSKPISNEKCYTNTQNKAKQTQFTQLDGGFRPLRREASLSHGAKPILTLLHSPRVLFVFSSPYSLYNHSMQTWTIQKLLNWMSQHFTDKGLESPRLNAELLLSHVLGLQRIELYTQFDKPVAKSELDKLHELVKRSGEGEPIAYLTGRCEFYSHEFEVNRDCLIPRPETELLVERAVEFLRNRPGRRLVCDLCTGCGCIAIAIAKSRPDTRLIATDISETALSVAAKNVEKYKLGQRIKLLCGDLFEPLIPQLDIEKFDLLVCNPPYVSKAEYEKLDKGIKNFEPREALYAGIDGLDVYRRICEKAKDFLKKDAALMLEVGYNQAQAVKHLLEDTGVFADIKIEKDYQNNDRIVIAKKQQTKMN